MVQTNQLLGDIPTMVQSCYHQGMDDRLLVGWDEADGGVEGGSNGFWSAMGAGSGGVQQMSWEAIHTKSKSS